MGYTGPNTLVAEMTPAPGAVRVTYPQRRQGRAAWATPPRGSRRGCFQAPTWRATWTGATHVLGSGGRPGGGGAPEDGHDPVLAEARDAFIRHAQGLVWVGYLSTTGVYGDHGGGWVDEATPLAPTTDRGGARAVADRGG